MELLNFGRILYTLIAGSSGIEIIFLVLDVIDHKKYEKKKKFNGGLMANYSRKTAGSGRYKMANYSWKTADLRRIQNGTLQDKSSKSDLLIGKTTF